MTALFRFPTAAQCRALRASPGLPLGDLPQAASLSREGEGESPPPVPGLTTRGSKSPAAGFTPPSLRSTAVGGTSAAVGQTIELPGAGPGGSISAVLHKRLEHQQLGYTAEHDARAPACFLPGQARIYVTDAIDLIKRDDDPARIRLKLVNAAALLLAAIDRHDHASISEAAGEPKPTTPAQEPL